MIYNAQAGVSAIHCTHLAMHRLVYKLMHKCGDSRVKDERDEEEEPKDTDNTQGAQEHGSVVLDTVQAGGRVLGVTKDRLCLCHGG